MGSKQLQFVPISSLINPSFWNKLSEIKINDDKLNEKEHSIWGYFSNINNKSNIPILEVNSTSFNSYFESQKIYIPFHGRILNVNTIETFKDFDKSQCINRIGHDLYASIENGDAIETPSLLNQFYVLSFADLKKFSFYYWFAFPVPYQLSITYRSVKNIYDDFTKDQLEHIWIKYCEMEHCQKPYFIVYKEDDSVKVFELKEKLKQIDGDNYKNYYFVYYDLSMLENCAGSTLRNYATLILHCCPNLQGKSANFLSLRIKRNEDYKLTIFNSLIFSIDLPECGTSVLDFINKDGKSWVGWEKNERGKLGPRFSNMKSFLDPKELAESSVDLNLKLMKWRLLSNIDLDKIKFSKFLLLGAGTLGCSVARILLGWGARSITFVDNSVVSYSNPVRQSLFTFEDSQNSKPKAMAAAENLRKIFPGVKANSYQMTIPMPGHPVGESLMEQVTRDVETLTKIISQHDVIFLLMDSRESRWLPTLLGSYFNKIVINAALGFDSYLVMRHGIRIDTEELKVRQYTSGFKSLKGNFLGCYFCNDVTAPGNSTKDRTLDQQCTVVRPGVSAIAGALAAELAISILQHKEGPKAPAFYQLGKADGELDNQCVLGIIPHSIRGYLSSFSQVLPAVERYHQCIACSQDILEAYNKDGFNFLLKVFQNSKYLEEISGVAEMNKEAEVAMIWEYDSEEEVQCTEYEDTDSEKALKINQDDNGIIGDEKVKNMDLVESEDVVAYILETLIQNVEKLHGIENDLTKNESEVSLTNTEYFNRILPDDILNIVKKFRNPSDCSPVNSALKNDYETFDSLQNFQETIPELNQFASCSENLSAPFSSSSVYSEFLPTADVTLVNEKFVSSSSSIFNSISGINNMCVPKDLLPVLEKQSSKRSSFYTSKTIPRKTPTIKQIAKPITIEYSFSNIDIKPVDLTPPENIHKNLILSESACDLEQIGEKASERRLKSSIMTLMSLVKNFGSSTSSQTISMASQNGKSNSSLTGKIKSFFVAKNMKSSSESLYVDDPNEHNKINDIITIAKPNDLFSSGSLTSDNLGLDESIYYLAETDSNNIKKS